MKTSPEIRVDNLRSLVTEYGGIVRLAEKIEKAEARISQWLNFAKNSKTGRPRRMSDDMARLIEEKCGKERGWMDHDHSDFGLEQFRKLDPAIRAALMRKAIVMMNRNQTVRMENNNVIQLQIVAV